MLRQTLAAAMMAPVLAACVVVSGDPDTLEEFVDLTGELIDRRAGLSPTPGPDLRTTGSASYDGVLSMTMPNGSFGVYSVVGNLDLDVAFAGAGSVSGSADGFIESSGRDFPGGLDIRDGVITRGPDQSGFAGARLTGSLNDGRSDFGIDRTLAGTFFGPNAEMVSGAIRDPGPVQIFGGQFIAER